MEHYIANFYFEKSKQKTNGKNYLVLYTVTENGSFGPVYVRKPEYRYVSKNSYSLEKAKYLTGLFDERFSFPHESNFFFDSDTNNYRIHIIGDEELSKYIQTKYKYKFFRQPQTDFFRTVIEGQDLRLDISSELEECMIWQKELNTKIRNFFSEFVMPIRSIKREYAISHKDAVAWLKLKEKSKENLARKVIRNRNKFIEVWEWYSEFSEKQIRITDRELKDKFSQILGSSKQTKNVSDRIYRIFCTPDQLLEVKPGMDKSMEEIEELGTELDEKIKKIHEDNKNVVDLNDMCAKLMLESGLLI